MNILLTGGSACGKSTYAEKLAVGFGGPLYYIAAMIPETDEGDERVIRHRRMRDGKGFITFERYTDVGGLVLPERGTALLECLCNLTANEMFMPGGAGRDAFAAVTDGVLSLADKCDNLIVVTNDVGSDIVEYDAPVNEYIVTLGRINAFLSERFDRVYELAAGIPIPLKGESEDV